MSEYPKTMTHPNAMKSNITKIISTDEAGRQVIDYSGTADKFPPVTVTNADQEERHRAQGYLTADDQIERQQYLDYPVWVKNAETGDMQLAEDTEQEKEWEEQGYARPIPADPEAVERAYASPYVPGRVVQEWPKMVNGVLTQDPNIDPNKPLEYPKWVHHPDRKQSHLDVCVNNAQEEEEVRAKFGLASAGKEPEKEEAEPVDPIREKLLGLAALEGIKVDLDWSNDQLKQALLGEPVKRSEDGEEEVDLSAIEDKDTLLSIASERQVRVDKRWSVAKIRSTLQQAAA